MRRLTFKNRGKPIEYTLARRPRVTKRLHMELDEQGGLVIVAPRHWSSKHVSSTLARNMPRVERFLADARQRHLPPLQYTQGEQHLFLGSYYPLAVNPTATGKGRVTLEDGEIRIDTPGSQPGKNQVLLQNWYRDQATVIFSERFIVVSGRALWTKDKQVTLKQRKMKRTWGNCSATGVVKLNTHLVKAPLKAIDSVIAHELCHLEEMNHSRVFYSLLNSINPDWRQDRAKLRLESHLYLRT